LGKGCPCRQLLVKLAMLGQFTETSIESELPR